MILFFLNVGVTKIISNGEFKPKQGISYKKQQNLMSNQRHHWNKRSIYKLIIIITKFVLKWMKHQPKFRDKIFK
jgi:hypothetical protein